MVRKRGCRLVNSAGAGDRMMRMRRDHSWSFQIDMLVAGKKSRKNIGLGVECGYVGEREKAPW
jgi:hypothetical protein